MSKQKINPEDFLKDINNILEMASKIDNLDDKKTDIINLSKKIKKKTSTFLSLTLLMDIYVKMI